MFLYNITLQRATGITHAIQGNFSGSKHQEVVVSRGKLLDVLRPDPNTGKVVTLLSVEVFGVIRSLMSFRLTGGAKGTSLKNSNAYFTLHLKFSMMRLCKAESMNSCDYFTFLSTIWMVDQIISVYFNVLSYSLHFIRVRLHRGWIWLGSHRHFGIQCYEEYPRENPPRNFWEEWMSKNRPWAILSHWSERPCSDDQ